MKNVLAQNQAKHSFLALGLGRKFSVLMATAAMFVVYFCPTEVLASGPSSNRLLNYQLRLTDSTGKIVADGSYNLKITLYTAATGGSQLYTVCSADGSATGTPTAVQATFYNGVASILLGDTSNTCASGSAVTIPATLFNNTSIYLGVTVASDSEMVPRKRIVGTGYSMNADRLDDLETSDSGGTSAFVPISDANGNLVITGNPQGTGVTQGSLVVNPAAADANEILFGVALGSSSKFQVDEDGDVTVGNDLMVGGKIGIGTSTPYYPLDLYVGSSGGALTLVDTDFRVESNSDAYISVLTPDLKSAGLIFSDPVDGARAGGMVYQGSSGLTDLDRLAFYAQGTLQAYIHPEGEISVRTLANGGDPVCVRDDVVTGFYTLSNCSSASRFKENIKPLQVDIDKVLQLSPVDFDWKETLMDDGNGNMVPVRDTSPSVGLIAEEVQKLLPDIVTYNKDGVIQGVDYQLLTVYELAILKRDHSLISNALKLDDSGLLYTIGAANAATVTAADVNSRALSFSGSVWNADTLTADDISMALKNTVTDADHYRLSFIDDADQEIAYFGNQGDLNIKGRLYLSDRGSLQNNRYLYYDGSSGLGGDFVRTNAAGWATGSYDFAEMFPSNDDLQAGELVMVDTSAVSKVARAGSGHDTDYLLSGVVSTRPGFLAGLNEANTFPIALAGRVPTKVNAENGKIKAGDPITISSEAGVGMRATSPCYVVGVALQDFDGPGEGTIEVFIKMGWFNGEVVAATDETPKELSGLTMAGALDMKGYPLVGLGALTSASGLWSIDKDGTLVVPQAVIGQVRTEQLTVEAADSKSMIGEGVILTGSSTLTVENPQVHFNSRIFITFYNSIEGDWWISERADGKFVLNLSKVAATDIHFEYWILDVADVRTPPSSAAPQSVPTEASEPVSGDTAPAPTSDQPVAGDDATTPPTTEADQSVVPSPEQIVPEPASEQPAPEAVVPPAPDTPVVSETPPVAPTEQPTEAFTSESNTSS